jgi:hypothetical protein
MKARALSASLSRSMDTARTTRSRSFPEAASFARVGISRMQGAHQVAHRFTTTTLPRKSPIRTGLPSASRKLVTGAGAASAGRIRRDISPRVRSVSPPFARGVMEAWAMM